MNSVAFDQWRQQVLGSTITEPGGFYSRQPLIMGVLNITPDSFSDGGQYFSRDEACRHAEEMIMEGADLIDLGGESSRPGAPPVSDDEELARVIPVIERIRSLSDICLSIDTYKACVMEAAVLAGASCINDIKALTEPGALAMAARLNVPVCLMHMRGEPASMQEDPRYATDVVEVIHHFFQQRITACVNAGLSRNQLILDPGFGFGKTVGHNLTIVKRLHEFQRYKLPLLLGVSRKSTLGAVLQKPPTLRLAGGIALAVFTALQGVSIIRTHDVADTYQALRMIDHVMSSQQEAG